MKTFRYIARNAEGRRVEGLVDGESAAGVSRTLVARGLYPVELNEADEAALDSTDALQRLRLLFERRRAGSQALALFTRRLGDLLDAGLPMHTAIRQLHLQTRDRVLRGVLRVVAERVHGGESLSQALSAHGDVFPRSLIGAVEAGETGGGLVAILLGLADLYEKEDDLERTVRSALIYPTLVLLVSIATLTVMFTFLLPKLTVLYEDLGQELPGPTRFLIGVSDFFRSYGLLAAVGVAALVGAFAFARARSESFRRAAASAVLRLPVVGRIILHREIVRFAHTLASLVGGGVPLMRGLWFASRCAGNAAVEAEVGAFGQTVGEGSSLSATLADSRIGDGALVMMVQVGEEMGELADSLEKACRVYERELRERMKVITTVLEPLLIVGLGLVVGFIVFSMMLPIMELNLV